MKKIIAALITAVVIISCSQNPEGFEIQGTLTGDLEPEVQAFLRKRNEEGRFLNLDTAIVVDGKYSFTGIQEEPEIHYIFFDAVRGNIPLIVENGTIEVSAQRDSLGFFKLKGTMQNDLFADFLEGSRAMSYRAKAMTDDMRKATTDMDTVQINSLRQEYAELQDEAKDFELNFVKENPNAYISVLIVEKAQLQKLLPEAEVQKLFEGLSPEMQNTVIGKRIKGKIEKGANVSVGSKAPNFSAPTPSGDELALNEVLGKITIVDFWAAWCRPCRAENPNLVRIYNKHKDQGLSILGVSLDRKAEDWKKAIADDGLEWNHVSNVDYFDEIAELYNVDAIPASFILDENGTIIAKDLRGSALEDKIAELLQ